jgi:hypothetical protein
MIHGQVSDLGEIPDGIEISAAVECETKDALIRSVSKGIPRAAVPTGYVARGDPADGLELTAYAETAIGIYCQGEHGWCLTLELAGYCGPVRAIPVVNERGACASLNLTGDVQAP